MEETNLSSPDIKGSLSELARLMNQLVSMLGMASEEPSPAAEPAPEVVAESAKESGPTGRDSGEDRVNDPTEVNENNASDVKKSLEQITQMVRSVTQEATKKKESKDIANALEKSIKPMSDRLIVLEDTVGKLFDAIGITSEANKAIEAQKSNTQANPVVGNSQEFAEMLKTVVSQAVNANQAEKSADKKPTSMDLLMWKAKQGGAK